MKKTWKIYEKKIIQEEGSKPKQGVFLISHEKFKILEFSILPSIDEEDRRRGVLKKLEERFVEGQALPFLYYEVLISTFEEEKILCCYLKGEFREQEFPEYIEFATPSFLLGKSIFEKKDGVLLDYGKKEIFFCVYRAGKIDSFQKLNRLQAKELVHTMENRENILLIGEYTEEEFFYWSEKFSILPLDTIKSTKVKKEMDIFQQKRLKKWNVQSFSSLFSKVLWILLFGNIVLGFYYQYQIENVKKILGQVEEENKILEVDSRKLEGKIGELRAEQQQEEEEQLVAIKKIVPALKNIYFLSSHFEIISLEYLETESFKLQFYSFSTKEYLRFLRSLILANFEFINHDYIEKQEEQYKVEIEIVKKEEL